MTVNDKFPTSDSINEIRNRTTEDILETKLETVWLTKGYSKSSVKEYVTHLIKELEYQKESFKVQLKEIMEEKERLLSEKAILSKQLEDSILALNTKQPDSSIELNKTIDSLKKQLEEKSSEPDIVELQTKLRDLNSYCETLELENYNLKNDVENQIQVDENEIVDSLKDENKKLNEQLESLSNKLAEIKQLKDESRIENDIVTSKVVYESQSEDFNRIKSENQLLQTEIISLTRSLQELNSRIINQTEKFNELTYELELERKKNNDSTVEKTELQVRLASYVEKFNEFQDQIEYLEKSSSILKRQLEEQRNKNRLLSGLDTQLKDGLKVTTFTNEE